MLRNFRALLKPLAAPFPSLPAAFLQTIWQADKSNRRRVLLAQKDVPSSILALLFYKHLSFPLPLPLFLSPFSSFWQVQKQASYYLFAVVPVLGNVARQLKQLRVLGQLLIELPHCKCQLAAEQIRDQTRMWTMDEHCQPQNEQVDWQLICISSPHSLSPPLSLCVGMLVVPSDTFKQVHL